MFTGLVEEVGHIKEIIKKGKSAVLIVSCKKVTEGSKPGDSIAVNGICLTVTKIENGIISFDLSFETVEKTAFKFLKPKTAVNLERALKVGDRLGGHILQGHVDTTAKVTGIKKVGESYIFTLKVSPKFTNLIVEKGSIGIDGISLTITEIKQENFSIAVIPTTYKATTLKFRRPGDIVNLEFDIIGKYIERILNKN